MRAIVLSRRPHREYDEIISLFTYDRGRVEALAKGNKKITSKQSAFLEPFSLIEAVLIPGREIYHLAKTQSVEYFPRIRSNLKKISLAGFAVSLTHTLVGENVPDYRIFLLLKNWLEFIDTGHDPSPQLLDGYVLGLMNYLGFTPELNFCVICAKNISEITSELLLNPDAPKPGLYYAGGGLICGLCRPPKTKIGEKITEISLLELNGLLMLMKADWRLITGFALSVEETKQLHGIVYQFLIYHSEIAVRDW